MMPRAGARYPDADTPMMPATPSSSHHAHTHTQQQHTQEMDAEQMYATINEYLQLEEKFQPRLYLPAESDNVEVTTGARDGAAHVLRCLKVWFDLPAEVLIHAINLFDRFLTKMKVRPCHLPCICVSSMNLAIDQHAINTQQERKISIQELVSVSQSACTARDVARMSAVMSDKLGCLPGARDVTPAHWAALHLRVLAHAARQLRLSPSLLPVERDVVQLLELACCDSVCANARTSELALVLVFHKLECTLLEAGESGAEVPEEAWRLFEVAAQLQAHCNMGESSLAAARGRLLEVERRYLASHSAAHKQHLVWRLSERTLKLLRPTDRLTSLLPTIEEQHLGVDATPTRNRSGSESSECEETSDWPRSPVLPVYCDN